MSSDFLSKAYTARDAAGTRTLYDDWAASYESEVADNGYATPRRCAEALAAHMPDPDAAILDFGCGTGLSGLALRAAGFSTLDGMDLSADMLRQAETKGIYRRTILTEPDVPPAIDPGAYAAIAAIGVIGAGAAPIAIFDRLMAALDPGGRLVWSFNDHALEDPANEAKLNEHLDTGSAHLLFREHGDHLPGIGIGSNVYVVEKA